MTQASSRHRSSPAGFTLVEALATIVILGIVGTIGSSILLTASDGYLKASTSAQLHTELSIALDRIVRELRKIELDAGAGGIAPDIDTVTATTIEWTDTDDDAYELSLSGTDLELGVDGSATAVLLTDVTAFSVDTYDEDDSALSASLSGAACDPIRRIEISITLQRYGVSETLSTKVYLRATLAGA